MNRHSSRITPAAPLPASGEIGAAASCQRNSPTGEAGAPNLPTYRTSARCPDCGAGLSYRVMDEDTGCAYPLDDGEHYCRHCDTVWIDEDVVPTGWALAEQSALARGQVQS